ncbi:MAG: threonylcarbamoyl-AMP synthase [Candidatus Levybacteria bacterium]|nr:threonylcarbamoyl-AMP synthase [Candidatus Levybacteria bacterium]
MDNIKKAVEILNRGGVIIFPTDTALGIGCRIDNKGAIKKLFQIRKRSRNKAVPVLVDSLEMAQKYLKPIDKEIIDNLINIFWPGALTIIMSCKVKKVPELVRGGGINLGVRVPDHPIILKIIKKIGVPLLAPSANFQGEKTPYKFKDLNKNLIKLVDYVLEDKTGTVMSPSTVIDCTKKPWKILREGAVKLDL